MMHDLARKFLVVKEMTFGSEISLLGEPVIITPSDFFTTLTEKIDDKALLYEVSRDSVKDLAENSKVMDKMSEEKRVRLMEKVASSAGWGTIEREKLEEKPFEAIAHIKNSSVTRKTEKKGKHDHIIRGMITGTLEEIYDRELVGIETECIADGDEKCVIKVKPEENFDPEVLEEYSNQLP